MRLDDVREGFEGSSHAGGSRLGKYAKRLGEGMATVWEERGLRVNGERLGG